MEFPKGSNSGKHLEPPQWDRGPAFSSFESGYIAGEFSFGFWRVEKKEEEKSRSRSRGRKGQKRLSRPHSGA